MVLSTSRSFFSVADSYAGANVIHAFGHRANYLLFLAWRARDELHAAKRGKRIFEICLAVGLFEVLLQYFVPGTELCCRVRCTMMGTFANSLQYWAVVNTVGTPWVGYVLYPNHHPYCWYLSQLGLELFLRKIDIILIPNVVAEEDTTLTTSNFCNNSTIHRYMLSKVHAVTTSILIVTLRLCVAPRNEVTAVNHKSITQLDSIRNVFGVLSSPNDTVFWLKNAAL